MGQGGREGSFIRAKKINGVAPRVFSGLLSNKVCQSFQRDQPLAIFSKTVGAHCDCKICFLNFQVGGRGGD